MAYLTRQRAWALGVLHPLALGWIKPQRGQALERQKGGGWTEAEHIFYGLNKLAFRKLLQGPLAQLLFFIVNVTINIMEILRNASRGSRSLVGLQYPDSLMGFLMISKGVFNSTEEEDGEGETSPNSIYPQQL